ncbi:MAG: hypothetical protein RIT27_846 [Pseudomonadota bacterium]|jgi:uncharacterized protein YqeY
MSLKAQLSDDMKTAMKAGEKARLAVIRLALAAIKQREVDERSELDDPQILAVLDKMIKQRRDSVQQYQNGNRQDLADQETFEISVLQEYLPQPLSPEEITSLIEQAISNSGATSAREMGKIMALLKPQLQGRADISAVSNLVKQQFN